MELADRVEKIRVNGLFASELAKIDELEKDRIYCRHGMGHLLDVARIGRIFLLEEGAADAHPEWVELMYAAALLHDIGRAREYEDGTPHDEASVMIAREVLPACGYAAEETDMICRAIEGHRGTDAAEGGAGEKAEPEDEGAVLARLLKKADKLSRPCYACEAEATCKWPDEKKNMKITV